MYFDLLPTEILPSIIKHVLLDANSREEEELEENMCLSSSKRKQIFNLSMLVSGECPFREGLSQLSLTEVSLGQVFDATCMWIDRGWLVLGPEFFESEALKVAIPEQLLQVCGESVKVVSFCMNWNENKCFAEKFAKIVKINCPNVENLNFVSLPAERCPY